MIWRWGTVRVRPPAAAAVSCRRAPAGRAILGRVAAPALVVLALLPGAAAQAAGAQRSGGPSRVPAWSPPVRLANACGQPPAPRVAFPSEGPSLRTGPGAIVWADGSACPGGAQLAAVSLDGAAHAGARTARPLPGALRSLDTTGASYGHLAVVTAVHVPSAGTPVAQVLQGRGGDLAPAFVARSYGAEPALARAYLGDAAVATVRRAAIAVRVERHYERSFDHAKLIPIGSAPVSALTITMDFRADVLVVWEQGGAVYAHMLRQSGRSDPTQRLGPSAPRPLLQALVSDNDHGMVAWSTTEGARPRTDVYLDLSAAGVAFSRARRLVSFADPAAVGRRAGSLALIRLSTENVLMAWTALEGGHYVVRCAPAVFALDGPSRRLSDPAGQSVLAAFVAGAAGEAVAVWSGSAGPSADPAASLAALWSARATVAPHDHVVAPAPALIARPGAGTAAGAAVDPGSDRAVVAWLAPGGALEYATAAAHAFSPHAPRGSAPAGGSGVHWLRIAAAALAVLAAAVAALLLWRRRAQRAGGALAGSRERRL